MKIVTVFVWMALAIGAGYAMFHINYRVEGLKAEAEALRRAGMQEREAIHILNAEWAYLARPERIQTLAEQFLPDMAPPTTTQITSLEALPHPFDPSHPPPAVPAPDVRAPGAMVGAARVGVVLPVQVMSGSTRR